METEQETTLLTSSANSQTNAPVDVQLDPSKDSIVSEVQSMASTIKFVVKLSLWSPEGIPKSGSKFEPISDAVLTSIRMLYCESPLARVCVVSNDLLLTDKETFVSQTKQEEASHKTLAVPSIGKVVAVEEEYITFTAWSVEIEILQLGVQYAQEMIEQLQEQIPSIEELRILVPQLIKDKVTTDVNKAVRDGSFDGLLHGVLGDDTIVSAVAGEEYATFAFFIPTDPTVNQAQPTDFQRNNDPDLTLIAIYVAIAVVVIIFAACMLVFYYYSKIESNADSKKETTNGAEEDSTSGADDNESSPKDQRHDPPPSMMSPSVTTDSDLEDLSTALASWQRKPARFILQTESECQAAESDLPDDGTDFPTAGSLVAGSVMVGSMMADSVESSLDGWSVHAAEINWS